ncbi:MAG: tetratricopeptide repeat protein, partial [Thermoanaerobaculia bacterium]
MVRFARRHRLGVTAAAALALTLVGGFTALARAFAESRARLAEAQRAEAIRSFLLELFAAIDPERARGREVPLREVVDHGADGPETARVLLALGDLHYWRDDPARALELQQRALAIFEIAGDGYRDDAAAARFNTGTALRQLERFEEALAVERRALELERQLAGDQSLAFADVEVGLALTLLDLGRAEEAVALAEHALAVRRRHLPEDHPRVADALEALGLA